MADVTDKDREAAIAALDRVGPDDYVSDFVAEAIAQAREEGRREEREACANALLAKVCDDDCFDDQCSTVRPCRRCVAYRRAANVVRDRGEGGKA